MAVIAKGKKPHVLAVPFPAQGHVTPLMKLSQKIANLGIKVTFVNTENIHEKIHQENNEQNDNIVRTSIPDGLSPEDDPNDGIKLVASLKTTMAGSLMALIEKINNSSNGDHNERISFIIADITVLGWILEVAEKIGAEPVCFTPASAASLALVLHIPMVTQQGNLDINGSIVGSDDNVISLSDNIPLWRKNELTWSCPFDLKTQKIIFECVLSSERAANNNLVKWLLCNTFDELESSSCDLMTSKLLHVGPLLNTKSSPTNSSSFRSEDMSCISWLNEKQASSVIYVSFGSIAVFSQDQLNELALGLELSGRPFLWVVRSDLANGARAEYPDGFLERSVNVGKIVEWAPQETVLSHPSIACFISHCGWNSTLEGVSNGVPFLCWPYFADQFHNENYICDKWENGLRIETDEDGVIRTRHEIKNKIDMLFCDGNIVRENALKLKEMAANSVDQGGSSSRNFQRFIDHLRE